MLTCPGVLIEVDESIMAIIDKINKAHEHAFILEPIDDRHALIRPNKLDELKELLREVSWPACS